jgi:outer membrane lipoprotein-sorting protein
MDGKRMLVAIVVIAITLTGSATAIETLQQPSGVEVLDGVEQRYESAETITTEATVTVSNGSESATATVEMAATADNRGRTIVSHDGETYRAGTNGTVAWAVGPNRSVAYPVDSLANTEAFDGTVAPDERLLDDAEYRFGEQEMPSVNASNVSATVIGTPSIDRTDTYEVELTHPEADGTTTLWVSQDDSRVVRLEATDGTNSTVVSVQSTAFNVSIHDSTFDPPTERVSLTTVDSYEEFDAAQAATEFDLPSPDGTFVEATVTVRQGETVVGQQYDSDERNVTVVSTTATDRLDRLTENATTETVDGQTVAVETLDDRAVVAWTGDDLTTAVVVEGSTDRALAIAGEL